MRRHGEGQVTVAWQVVKFANGRWEVVRWRVEIASAKFVTVLELADSNTKS